MEFVFKSRYSWALSAMASFVNFHMSAVEADMRIVARQSSGNESKSLCLI